MTFEETVKSMTFRQLVLAMVAGLRKRWVRVEMGSFGGTDSDGVCVGCAATNTICQIYGVAIPASHIITSEDRAEFVSCELKFLSLFETAIDHLRAQRKSGFNETAKSIGIALAPEAWSPGCRISNGFTEEQLQSWEKSVEYLMTFEEKVKSMTFKQIVLAMVAGLRKRWVGVDMGIYGGMTDDGVCYGCAATNTICQIHGKAFTPAAINSYYARAAFVGSDSTFLCNFEDAIDCLRCGLHLPYNIRAGGIGLAQAPADYCPGSALTTDFTEADLQSWEKSVEHLE